MYEESDDPRSGVTRAYLDSREGIINMHSLIWNQFGSENYTDMLRYAWHNTDPHWSIDEINNRPMPRGVLDIQFKTDKTRCDQKDHITNTTCSRPAFIRCSHCGKILCLHQFMERVCIHNINEERAGPSGTSQAHMIDSDSDDDYHPNLFRHREITTSSTTTESPYGDRELAK